MPHFWPFLPLLSFKHFSFIIPFAIVPRTFSVAMIAGKIIAIVPFIRRIAIVAALGSIDPFPFAPFPFGSFLASPTFEKSSFAD
jgi:hypothetical protein